MPRNRFNPNESGPQPGDPDYNNPYNNPGQGGYRDPADMQRHGGDFPGGPPPGNNGLPPVSGGPGGSGGYPGGDVWGQFQNFFNNQNLPNTQVGLNFNASPEQQAYENALRSSIMSAIQEGQRPVDENDPTLAPVISAMRGQAQRAQEQNKAQVGERLFAQGIPISSGAYDTATQGFNQAQQQGTQANVANVMINQLNDRRNRLMTALNIGNQYLNQEQSRTLQAELANVNNALAAYGLRSNVSLGLLSALLGNAHFYDQLGTNANQFAQNQNNQSVTF